MSEVNSSGEAPSLSRPVEGQFSIGKEVSSWMERADIAQIEKESKRLFEKETKKGGLVWVIEEVVQGLRERYDERDLEGVVEEELNVIRDGEIEGTYELIAFWGLATYVTERLFQERQEPQGKGNFRIKREQIFGGLAMAAGSSLGLEHDGNGSQTDNGEGKTIQLHLATLWRIYSGDLVIRGTRDSVLGEKAAKEFAEIAAVFGWQVGFVEKNEEAENLFREKERCLQAMVLLDVLEMDQGQRQELRQELIERMAVLRDGIWELSQKGRGRVYAGGLMGENASYKEMEENSEIKVIFGGRDLVFPAIPLDVRYRELERKRFGLFDEASSLIADELAPFVISSRLVETGREHSENVFKTFLLLTALEEMQEERSLIDDAAEFLESDDEWYFFKSGQWELTHGGMLEMSERARALATERMDAFLERSEELVVGNQEIFSELGIRDRLPTELQINQARLAGFIKPLHLAFLDWDSLMTEYDPEMTNGVIFAGLNLNKDRDYVVQPVGETQGQRAVLISASTKEALPGHVLDSPYAQLSLYLKEGIIPSETPSVFKEGELSFAGYLRSMFTRGNLGLCGGDLVFLARELENSFSVKTIAVPLINWRDEGGWRVRFHKQLTKEEHLVSDEQYAPHRLLGRITGVYREEKSEDKTRRVSFMIFAGDNIGVERTASFLERQTELLEAKLGGKVRIVKLKFGANLSREQEVMQALAGDRTIAVVADNAAIGRDPEMAKDDTLVVIEYGPAETQRLERQRQMRTGRAGNRGRVVSIYWKRGRRSLLDLLQNAGLLGKPRREELRATARLTNTSRSTELVRRVQENNWLGLQRYRALALSKAEMRQTLERQWWDFSQTARQKYLAELSGQVGSTSQSGSRVGRCLTSLANIYFPFSPEKWDFFVDRLAREWQDGQEPREDFDQLESLFGRENLAAVFLTLLTNRRSSAALWLGKVFDNSWRSRVEGTVSARTGGFKDLRAKLAEFSTAPVLYGSLFRSLMYECALLKGEAFSLETKRGIYLSSNLWRRLRGERVESEDEPEYVIILEPAKGKLGMEMVFLRKAIDRGDQVKEILEAKGQTQGIDNLLEDGRLIY